MPDIKELISLIGETQQYFKQKAQQQVNTALTLRNWLFGYFIVEYELNGADKAVYGEKLFKEIAYRASHISGLSERNLYLFKNYYLAYPNILQSPTAKLYLSDFKGIAILQSLTAKLQMPNNIPDKVAPTSLDVYQAETDKLLTRLSFTHIIELLKADTALKRSFYETESIKNCWSVRELQRAMNSMLFERSGLSTNKQEVLNKQANKEPLLHIEEEQRKITKY